MRVETGKALAVRACLSDTRMLSKQTTSRFRHCQQADASSRHLSDGSTLQWFTPRAAAGRYNRHATGSFVGYRASTGGMTGSVCLMLRYKNKLVLSISNRSLKSTPRLSNVLVTSRRRTINRCSCFCFLILTGFVRLQAIDKYQRWGGINPVCDAVASSPLFKLVHSMIIREPSNLSSQLKDRLLTHIERPLIGLPSVLLEGSRDEDKIGHTVVAILHIQGANVALFFLTPTENDVLYFIIFASLL